MSLSPSTVSLAPSGTQQFTATVLGTSNTAVTWSINPPVGTISSAGLYTAPSSILTSQTVTVTAQSVAAPAKSASGVVSLQATPVLNQWSIGYYSPGSGGIWMPVSAIQWTGLTHVIQIAVLVNADGTLDLTAADFLTDAAPLIAAAHSHGVKALVCVEAGEDTQSNFNSAIENHLSAFVANIMTVVSTYGYDGVDIDWEVDGGAYAGFIYDPTSSADMKTLASALRTALGSKILTVAATQADAAYWGTSHTPFDRIDVMTYGMTGLAYASSGGGAWYSAAIYNKGADSIYDEALDSIRTSYLAAGVPASKLGLGLPFFGVQWSGGVLASDPTQGISGPRQAWQAGSPPTSTMLSYSSVLPLITQQNYTWDSSAMVPYINYLGSTPSTYRYITYDNPQSIQAKVQYTIAQGLGGWIIWHLGADYVATEPHPHPLLDAVQAGSAPAVLSASALSSGTVGRSYGASLSATGVAPLHWALSSGSIPNGLSLSSVGVISGTPATAGTFTFIVTVGNFAGSARTRS